MLLHPSCFVRRLLAGSTGFGWLARQSKPSRLNALPSIASRHREYPPRGLPSKAASWRFQSHSYLAWPRPRTRLRPALDARKLRAWNSCDEIMTELGFCRARRTHMVESLRFGMIFRISLVTPAMVRLETLPVTTITCLRSFLMLFLRVLRLYPQFQA